MQINITVYNYCAPDSSLGRSSADLCESQCKPSCRYSKIANAMQICA